MAVTKVELSLFTGIDDKHIDLDELEKDWDMIEDIMAGERRIKSQGTKYLAKLTGQKPNEYSAYLNRGYFYGAFSRTVTGLTGAVMRKPVEITAPAKIEEYFDPISVDGLSIQEVVKSTASGLLAFGRHGILVDLVSTGEGEMVYLTEYPASSVLNWRVEIIGGEHVLTFLTLYERDYRTDSTNEFITHIYDQIRVLKLDDNGELIVNLFEREIGTVGAPAGTKESSETSWMQIEVVSGSKDHYPKKSNGQKWTEIPFVFFGAVKNGADPNKPPLLDLANVNMAHWRLIADYFHGLHYCALPTPYAFGITKKEKFTIGPTVAIVDANENAKAGMLEFTGQGMAAVRDALNDLEKKMAVLGARFLEESKRERETAAAMEIRASADAATLTSIAQNLDYGFEKVIVFMCEWKNIEGEVSVRTNKDFVPVQMTAKEITALLQAVQSGKLSMNSFLYQMKTGEIIPDFVSIEEEKKLIKKDQEEVAKTTEEKVSDSEKDDFFVQNSEEDMNLPENQQ